MGSGGTTALQPPGKFCCPGRLAGHPVNLYQLKIVSVTENSFGVVRLSLTVH